MLKDILWIVRTLCYLQKQQHSMSWVWRGVCSVNQFQYFVISYTSDSRSNCLLQTNFSDGTYGFRLKHFTVSDPLAVIDVEHDIRTSYTFPHMHKQWADAQRYCQEKGGHLAIIKNVIQNNFIQDIIGVLGKKTNMCYVKRDTHFRLEPGSTTRWNSGSGQINPSNLPCASLIIISISELITFFVN